MKWRNRRAGMRSNRAPGAKQYSVWRFDRGGARKGRGGDPEREGIFPTRPLRPDVVAEGGSIGRGGAAGSSAFRPRLPAVVAWSEEVPMTAAREVAIEVRQGGGGPGPGRVLLRS